ncbi:MAG: SH3 domain-containing protein [Nitrospinae bacterium]|nr:SH3 domain-containing protein [Nitrospinota bacterium]
MRDSSLNRRFSICSFWSLSLLLAGLFFAPGLRAETLYAKTDGTKVMDQESAQSQVVAVLNQGSAVEVTQKGGKFFKVKLSGGKEGWVFKFKLTEESPSGDSGGGDALDVLGGKQQIAARESGSGSSIRGLSPISEKNAQSKGISPVNIQAVKQMESFKATPQELDKFLKEGRLGEYQ